MLSTLTTSTTAHVSLLYTCPSPTGRRLIDKCLVPTLLTYLRQFCFFSRSTKKTSICANNTSPIDLILNRIAARTYELFFSIHRYLLPSGSGIGAMPKSDKSQKRFHIAPRPRAGAERGDPPRTRAWLLTRQSPRGDRCLHSRLGRRVRRPSVRLARRDEQTNTH